MAQLEIYIRKPPNANYPAADEWLPLKVERIDFDVNNDVAANAITSDETRVYDVAASTIQMLLTGIVSGDTATADMWELIVCAREWKFASISQSDITTNARVKWRDRTEYMMINRLTFVEVAETDANELEFLLTLALRTAPRT